MEHFPEIWILEVDIILTLVGILFFVWVIWMSFFRPYNVMKDYTQLGYNFKSGSNDLKRALVNRTLQRRKIGKLPPPYPNSWYAVLEAASLRQGEVKEVCALGRNLVAWRGKVSGQAFVADAYCPHLGAHLGVGGSVINDCIQCPFHKWTFDGCSGNAQEIPYTDNNNRVVTENLARLKIWQSMEANGFVYIWFHAEGDKPSWYPGEIEGMSSGKWKYHGRSEFQVTCHIQEIPENGADVAHLAALHESPAICDASPTFINLLGTLVKHKWSADWKVNPEPGRGHESHIDISHHMSLFSDKLSCFHVNVTVKQIGAGIVIMNFSTPFWEGVLVQSVTPIEPLLQKITHRFYSSSRCLHLLALFVLHSETIQISRDIEIWNRKCYLHKPILVKEDGKIRQFRRWFTQFYSEEKTGKCDTANSKILSDELW